MNTSVKDNNSTRSLSKNISLSENISHSNNSTVGIRCHRSKRKEYRSKSLKPQKHYPLPLPKSVPHISRSFFTEHLFINCVFKEELVSSKEGINNSDKSVKFDNEAGSNISRYNSTLNKPKIPAPDFKLRESRKALVHHITRSNVVLSVQQNCKTRRINSINNLINDLSNERICRNQSKIRSKQNHKIKSIFGLKVSPFRTKESYSKVVKNTVFSQHSCLSSKTSDSSVTYSSTILDNSKIVNISYNSTDYSRNKIPESTKRLSYLNCDLSLLNKSDSYNFYPLSYCGRKSSEVKNRKPKKSKNKSYDPKRNFLNTGDKIKTENKKPKSEDISIKLSTLSKGVSKKDVSNASVQSKENSSTTSLKKLGFAFVHSTKEINKKISDVYTCIIKKIDAYFQYKTYNLFENRDLITSRHFNETLIYKIRKDKYREPSDKFWNSLNSQMSTDCKCDTSKNPCICKPTGVNVLPRKYKYISESLFYGPTIDEVLLHLFDFLRYIGQLLGLICEDKPKPTGCCGSTECSSDTCDAFCDIGRNNTDVVKWLHDEYINLAKDIAETNKESQHNCPCNQENNCPIVLQSRRFVLDRLAELLEKKQELEIVYRRSERSSITTKDEYEKKSGYFSKDVQDRNVSRDENERKSADENDKKVTISVPKDELELTKSNSEAYTENEIPFESSRVTVENDIYI